MSVVLTLIARTVCVDGNGFETVTERIREIFAEEKSVNGREFYAAAAAGIAAEKIYRLRSALYAMEETVEQGGARYQVIRSYRAGEWTELTVRRIA